jgi:hypothetical protein
LASAAEGKMSSAKHFLISSQRIIFIPELRQAEYPYEPLHAVDRGMLSAEARYKGEY